MSGYSDLAETRKGGLLPEEVFNAIKSKWINGVGNDVRKETQGDLSVCIGNYRYFFPDSEDGPDAVRDALLEAIEKNKLKQLGKKKKGQKEEDFENNKKKDLNIGVKKFYIKSRFCIPRQRFQVFPYQ